MQDEDENEICSVIKKIDKFSLVEKTNKFYSFRLLEPEEDDDLTNEDEIVNNFILKEEKERRDIKQFSKISNFYLQKLKNNTFSKNDNNNLLILFKKLRKKIIIYNYFLLFDADHPLYENDTPKYKKEMDKASRYFKNLKISLFSALNKWESISKLSKKKVLSDCIIFFNTIRTILLDIYEDENLYEEEKFDIFLETMKNL